MKKMMLAMAVTGLLGAGVAMAEDAAAETKAMPQLPMMEPVADAPKPFSWDAVPEVVAQVGEQKITRDQLKDFVGTQLPGGGIPADAPQAPVMMMLYQMTEALVKEALLADALKANGLPAFEENARQQLQKELDAMTPEQRQILDTDLEAQNMTLEQALAQLVGAPGVATALAEKALADKLGADVKEATPEAAKAFYDENLQQYFTEPGYVEVAHILLQPKKDGSDDAEVKAKLEGILAEVRANPELFAEKAKAESACPSKEKGGELGARISADNEQFDRDFVDAVMPLKAGEISDVFKTQFGYHIAKCLVRTEDKVEPFTPELQKNLQDTLTLNAKMDVARKYLAELSGKLKPEVLMEKPQFPMQMMMR